MRILNDKTLQNDIDNTFDVTLSHFDKKVRDWFKGSWLKQLVKTDWFVQHFLHPIEATKTRFQGIGRIGSMTAKVPASPVAIRAFTEWDMKDAAAGILKWYAPTQYSLSYYKYLDDVVLIRDFFNDLIDQNPDVDLRRYNAVDALTAAKKWHADIEKRERERRAREEAERAALYAQMAEREKVRMIEAAENSLRVFRRLEQDVDWRHVLDFDHAGIPYSLIRLVSGRALDAESEVMSHCTYNYKRTIFNGKCVIVSVRHREAKHQTLITAEIYTPPLQIIQIRGYHNENKMLPAGLEDAVRDILLNADNIQYWTPLVEPKTLEFRVRLNGNREQNQD